MKTSASVVLLSCLMFACAGARDVTRVEPLLFLPHQREIALAVRASEQPVAPFIIATCDHGTRGAVRCSHVSVRLDTVLAISTSTPSERNRILSLLLGVSDYNCAAFTAQAFGREAQLQTANTILNSVSALAAKSEKKTSLVDLLNFAEKTANGVLNQPSQTGSPETAVEIAIGDARRTQRERIARRGAEQLETYALIQALADLTTYDEICSLQRGKELALQAAAVAAREETERVLKVLSQQTASNNQ